MRSLRLPALVLLALLAAREAPPALAADPTGDRVAEVVRTRSAKTVRVSAAVWDVGTGRLLHATNADVPRRPASVAKIATTAAAWLALGPAHELTTEVFATARPDRGGVVDGSLVVRGGGDPGFSEHLHPEGTAGALRDLAQSVAAAGVRRVEGDLVLDATRYVGPEREASWGWKPGHWADYTAPVTALTVNDGCADVRIVPAAAEGAAASVTVEPPTSLLTIVGRIATGPPKSKNDATIGAIGADGRVPVQGSIPRGVAGIRTSVAAVDPVAYFGDAFRAALATAGVRIDGAVVPVRSPAAPGAGPSVAAGKGLVPIARRGTPVARIAAVANTRSQNLFAELLGREVGIARRGEGSFAAGAVAVGEVHGFAADDRAFRLADGSGLARANQVTASAIGKILLAMAASPHAAAFRDTLAKAGDPEGTLKDRFEGPKFAGRVFAKTGTLRDTKSLAGYVVSRSGRTYAFVVLCEGDNGKAKALQDALVAALVE